MSSRVHSMGAGLAASSSYGVNVNLNTAGGDKKQGLPPYANMSTPWANRACQIRANGSITGRNTIFTMNQLTGVSSSIFASSSNNWAASGNVRNIPPYQFGLKSS